MYNSGFFGGFFNRRSNQQKQRPKYESNVDRSREIERRDFCNSCLELYKKYNINDRSSKSIKKKNNLKVHPDKNKLPDAENDFKLFTRCEEDLHYDDDTKMCFDKDCRDYERERETSARQRQIEIEREEKFKKEQELRRQ